MDEAYAKARKADARKKPAKPAATKMPLLISISEIRKRGILPISDTQDARKRCFMTK